MDRQSTDQQLIEALTKRLDEGTITDEQAFWLCDLIDDLRGENANQVLDGPPVEVAPGEFSRGKARHR